MTDLRQALEECVAVMRTHIYPKPDAPPEHPWNVLQRAEAALKAEAPDQSVQAFADWCREEAACLQVFLEYRPGSFWDDVRKRQRLLEAIPTEVQHFEENER